MKTHTRQRFNALLHGLAKGYGVEDVSRQFAIEPTIQQRLQDKIVEQSTFLPKINVITVDELSGENILGSASGPVSGRTDTSKDGKERTPRDVLGLASYKYQLHQTNSDVFMRYATMDAWAKFPDMPERYARYVQARIANDRELIGWYGTSAAADTDLEANPLLQDVNIGWLQYVRANRPEAILAEGAATGEIRIGPEAGADYANLDVAVNDLVLGIPEYMRSGLVALIGAELIARLADGALRDALSILDTCAGVTAKIDADVVRRMAGVTDRSYLFHISDALEAQDAAAALAQLAQLRQQSVDVKRLTEELIAHYRALMLAALPGGQALLSGVSPEEEALYLQKGPEMGQREAIRAIRTLGTALEHMTRGSDQRIELELALFSLSEPPQQMQAVTVQAAPARAAQPEAPRPFAAAVQPFASAPVQPAPAATAPQTPAAVAEPAPAVQEVSPQPAVPEAPPAPAEELPPMPEEPPVQQSDAALPWDEPAPQAPPPEEPEPVSQPEQPAPAEPTQSAPAAEEPPAPVQEHPADPVLTKPRSVAQQGTNPFPYWGQIVQKLEGIDPMLYMYLRKSKAYFDGTRVLIDGGKTFRDFIRVNKDSQKLIKKLIAEVSGVPVPIGPYEPKTAGKTASNAEQSLLALEKLGLEVSIEDTARKKR